MAKIRYIGKKERKTTTLTNVVWNGHGDVQEVSDHAVVAKLLVHTDSFELAGTVQVEQNQDAGDKNGDDPTVKNDEAETEAPPMVNLETMDKQALREYAQRYFGHEFHHKVGEDKMRQTIIGLMNRG